MSKEQSPEPNKTKNIQPKEIQELIEFDRKRLNELLKKEKILDALMAAGVDNWDGYDAAIDSIDKSEIAA